MKRPIAMILALLLTAGLFAFVSCGEEPIPSAQSIASQIQSTESTADLPVSAPQPQSSRESIPSRASEPRSDSSAPTVSNDTDQNTVSSSQPPETSSAAHVHTFVGDCDKDCDACGFERTVTHAYTSDCDGDCNTCGLSREVPPHVFKDDCDAICDVKNCTYTRIPAHYLTEATCTSPKKCTKCRITYGTALGHAWSQGKCLVEDICTRCGTSGYVYHSYEGDSCTRCNAPTSSVPRTLP